MSIKIVSERTKAEKEWEKRKIEIEEMLENAIIEICYFFEGTGTNVGERLIELVHYCAQKLMQKDIKDEEKANFEKYLKEPIEEGLKYMICEYCNDDRANLKKNNRKYIEYFLGMSMILNETMEINIKAPKLLDKTKALELLGKHLGMFKEKVTIDGNVNTNNPFSGMSIEELRKILNE